MLIRDHEHVWPAGLCDVTANGIRAIWVACHSKIGSSVSDSAARKYASRHTFDRIVDALRLVSVHDYFLGH